MELKHDCVRDLLLTLESDLKINQMLDISEILTLPEMSKYTRDDVEYTINKLNEAGFIEIATFMGGGIAVLDITYNGHQFLDNVRSAGIWAETKERLAKVGGAASLNIISTLATSLVNAKLGLTE
ncbi:DUF2513 domain-containing protein [Bacillus inaquosorum]|uniref:DUF2513 domain-containing protein n=1 Tax=Bacillus inaquosorum TaxID=483913 RepID=UPI002281E01D|nr:DUF2513 domain-containing protein [Bacillus inaquosorum]MCY7977482.1 DUF2513 domain-containing protein [Bacillus inaquosorum]MEC0589953.1 DUF2513 domain-containing protein [Bacillus inaquosorum]